MDDTDSVARGQVSHNYGMSQCLASLPTRTWKLHRPRQALQPSWRHSKVVKYARLSSQGEFVPISAESRGPINRDALQFLSELGKLLVETTRDVRASSFLFQRISVVVQRSNSVLLHDGFIDDDRPE